MHQLDDNNTPLHEVFSLTTSELSAVFLMVEVTAILTSRYWAAGVLLLIILLVTHPLNKVTRR